MGDGEASLSDGMNKYDEPVTEGEELEISGMKGELQCESISELGESSPSVGGESNGAVSLEDKAVVTEGGKVSTLDNNNGVVGDSEVVVEPIGGEVMGEESGSGMISLLSEVPLLQSKAEEETELVDNAKGDTVVTDTGDAPAAIGELHAGSVGNGLVIYTEHKKKAEVEISSGAEANLEEIVCDERNEPFSSEADYSAIVCTKVEELVADGGSDQEFSDVKEDARRDELPALKEETGALDNKSDTGMDVVNNAETVMKGDEADKVRIDVLANEPEVGAVEKPFGVKEEKTDPMIIEEISPPEVRSEAHIITGVSASKFNSSEQEQVWNEDNVHSDVKCEITEDRKEAPDESLISETKMVEQEVTRDNLDVHVNVPENLRDIDVKEGAPAEDTATEMMVGMELELKRNVVEEENRLGDLEAETEAGSEEDAHKIPEMDGTMQMEETIDSVLDEDGNMENDETASGVDEPSQDISDSPAALQDDEEEAMVPEEEAGAQDTEMETETDIADSGKTSGGKRKRGKSLKSAQISKSIAKSSSRRTVGEDVCFICFDGGELVLCDRRYCTKAYHPSCVNRDEAFFRSKGKWNCGWHQCSICEKNARYMCYTCTFSLCKNCTKDAVILCIRGKNKGFCETCMKTVQLIENNGQGNEDTQIDFDDRSSWEYLFKDYYTELKAKLALTSADIAEAKNPWKGADMSGPNKQELSEGQADANNGGSGSDDSVENTERIRPKRRKTRKPSKPLNKEKGLVSTAGADGKKAICLSGSSSWASNELLEFVSHMKNGDTSVLSQFDVQALLLEYIKTNKLRDPRRKSHIVCDARLENIFGKPRVGHFEMLKLLESHFLVRDEQNDDVQGSVVDTENNQLEIDGNTDSLTKTVKDKKRKSRKKSGNRGPQSNLDDYAAVDMHNIGLIYLRRKLMEDLLEDAETFHDKVVGTFVRIRIYGSTQKQDLYRLVQVVGTSKAAEPYKLGKKTTDIMVEILNLDKTEIISMDTISNQEFSEEECKRLRQSIKCGLISRLSVGEILDKTMELQAARVNDWLESETLRLSHLRDRASDLGRRKELRECVEKLNVLKTPEERQRRLGEIPEIHADPKMDPSYESDDDDGNEIEDNSKDTFLKPRGSGFSRRERGQISPGRDNSLKDSRGAATKVSTKNLEPSRNPSGINYSSNSSHTGDVGNEKSWNMEREKATKESYNIEKRNSVNNSETAERAQRSTTRSESFPGTSASLQVPSSAGVEETVVKVNESEKMWHYKDPSGKVQGPFSVMQLRKWNNTGYFPADLRIWRMTETQDNAILLSDALAGKFPKESPAVADILSAINTLRGSHTLAELSGKTSGASLQQEKESSIIDQKSGTLSNLPTENWRRNESLPSPTPKQNTAALSGVEGGIPAGVSQSPGINGVLPSPTAIVPNTLIHSSTASILVSVLQNAAAAAFSPTPNSQQGSLAASAVSLQTQSNMTTDPQAVMTPGHMPAAVQPIQNNVTGQNPQIDALGWGGGTPPGQPQAYGWNASSIQSSAGNFANSGNPGFPPDVWKPPTQGSQPDMPPPAAPNMSWGMGMGMGMGPADNSNSMGAMPENPNVAWGPMQANPNMGWGNMATGNTNMNWGPAMQAPPPGNTTAWVAPTGNTAANMQGMMPANVNPVWNVSQGWSAPTSQVPMPNNGWGGPPGGPAPMAQVPSIQGNTNQAPQGWVAPPPQPQPQPQPQPPPQPPANQGSWRGDQNNSGRQFSGHRGGRGHSGYSSGGGRPWNRQSSFGGGRGGSRHYENRGETACPYLAKGRCRKGAGCDYLHS